MLVKQDQGRALLAPPACARLCFFASTRHFGESSELFAGCSKTVRRPSELGNLEQLYRRHRTASNKAAVRAEQLHPRHRTASNCTAVHPSSSEHSGGRGFRKRIADTLMCAADSAGSMDSAIGKVRNPCLACGCLRAGLRPCLRPVGTQRPRLLCRGRGYSYTDVM